MPKKTPIQRTSEHLFIGATETSKNITARVIERDTSGEIYYFLAPWFVCNEVIYCDLKVKPLLPYIKNLCKRFFDNLPNIPNQLIRIQPAYDPAVPSSQKHPRVLLDQEFVNFPQAKMLRA
ncbi:RNA-directed DNA polymerase from mobile element jockey [Trichonephila clavipes]|nr:RNA-directed DNA polymerase from mobile element jockey [Trichonephila clavipes]